MTLWRIIIAFLTWLSVEPAEVNQFHARATAAGMIARASMLDNKPEPPPPSPTPVDCVCGGTCKNGVWKPDGRVEQKCDCECDRCVKERASKPVTPASTDCPGGVCPPKSTTRYYIR